MNRARFEHMSRLPQRSNTEPLRRAAAWQRSGATLRCTGRCSASPRYQQPLPDPEAARSRLKRAGGTCTEALPGTSVRMCTAALGRAWSQRCGGAPHTRTLMSGQGIPAPRHFGVRKWWELPALTDTGLGPSNAASQCCPAAAGRGEHHVDRTSADAGVVMDVEMGRKLADIQ